MNTNCPKDLLDAVVNEDPEIIDHLVTHIINTFHIIDKIGDKTGFKSPAVKFHAAMRLFMYTIRQFHITHCQDIDTAGQINQEIQKIISAVASRADLFDNRIVDLYIDLAENDNTFKENLN